MTTQAKKEEFRKEYANIYEVNADFIDGKIVETGQTQIVSGELEDMWQWIESYKAEALREMREEMEKVFINEMENSEDPTFGQFERGWNHGLREAINLLKSEDGKE